LEGKFLISVGNWRNTNKLDLGFAEFQPYIVLKLLVKGAK